MVASEVKRMLKFLYSSKTLTLEVSERSLYDCCSLAVCWGHRWTLFVYGLSSQLFTRAAVVTYSIVWFS